MHYLIDGKNAGRIYSSVSLEMKSIFNCELPIKSSSCVCVLSTVLEVYQFARDAAVAEAWLIAQEPHLMSSELGHTIDEVENLIKKHEAFEKSAAAQEERFIALRRLTTVRHSSLFIVEMKFLIFRPDFSNSLSSKKLRDVKMRLKRQNVNDFNKNKTNVQQPRHKQKLFERLRPEIHMMLQAHLNVKQVISNTIFLPYHIFAQRLLIFWLGKEITKIGFGAKQIYLFRINIHKRYYPISMYLTIKTLFY